MNDNTLSKIKPIAQIASEVKVSKENGVSIVHCHGEFDLLHIGHTRYFKAAKKFGDVLIVTLTPDRFIMKGPGRPVFNEDLRAEAIANLEFVDFVGINEWETAEETLKMIQPDVYVKGSEYLNKVDVTGRLEREKQLIESLGGKMEFTHEIVFSSSQLLNKHFDVFSKESQSYLHRLSQQYDAMEIVEALDQLKSLKLLVIGEARIDQHTLCSTSRQEGIMPLSQKSFYQPKGALSVANHLVDFCDNVDCVLVASEDLIGQELLQEIIAEEVNLHLFSQQGYLLPTVTQYWDEDSYHGLWKVRHTHSKTIDLKKTILEVSNWLQVQEKYDAIMIVDLGLGLMNDALIEELNRRSSFIGVAIGTGDLHPGFNPVVNYSGFNYLCLSEESLSGLTQNPHFSLSDWGNQLSHETNSENIILTQSYGGNKYWDGKQFIQLPNFVDLSVYPIPPQDLASAVFAVTAPLAMLHINRDWQLLIGNAVVEITRQSTDSLFQLSRMTLDKFIIALLNR